MISNHVVWLLPPDITKAFFSTQQIASLQSLSYRSRFACTVITELFDTLWPLTSECAGFCSHNQPHWNSLDFHWLQCRLGAHIQHQFLWHSASTTTVHSEGLYLLEVYYSPSVSGPPPLLSNPEPRPRASDGTQKVKLMGGLLGYGAALGKPGEILSFQYWTCCMVGLAPCNFDRRLHTNSCCKQAKNACFSPISSQYQLIAVSNKDSWELYILTGYTSILKGNSLLLGLIFFSSVVSSLLKFTVLYYFILFVCLFLLATVIKRETEHLWSLVLFLNELGGYFACSSLQNSCKPHNVFVFAPFTLMHASTNFGIETKTQAEVVLILINLKLHFGLNITVSSNIFVQDVSHCVLRNVAVSTKCESWGGKRGKLKIGCVT